MIDLKYNINRLYVYDIEIYVNLFLMKIFNVQKRTEYIFEISKRKDDSLELFRFLQTVPTLVGYNNLRFDYRLLHEFIRTMIKEPNIKRSLLVQRLKLLANKIIAEESKFNPRKVLIPQIDLMLIHRYDALRISLKELEFSMRQENVENLPYPEDKILSENEIVNVISYLDNDIDSTRKFLEDYSFEHIKVRYEMSKLYSWDMMNYSYPVLGEKSFALTLQKELGIDEFGQTVLDKVALKDIIFNYIKFESEPFKRIYSYFYNEEVTNLKGFFTEIPFEKLESLEGYYAIEKKNGCQKNLNVVFDNVVCVYGSGGIHASINRKIIESNDEYIILDLDVESFYPNLSVKNRFYPLHIGENFCNLMDAEFQARKLIPKSNPINKAIKEKINSVYGKSNSEYGIFRDMSYTLKTTINGQLLLSMLAESIILNSNSKLIQINTDGISIYTKRDQLEIVEEIYHSWEKLTKLTLDVNLYKKMIIRDVNNYIWIKENGDRKRKGAYEWKPELHKDHSMLIVPRAVENFYLTGQQIEDFIRSHKDIYDFMIKVRVDKNTNLVMIEKDKEERLLQKLTRYYVSNQGGSIVKRMKPIITESNMNDPKYQKFVLDKEKYSKKFNIREIGVQANWLCTEANDLRGKNHQEILENINFDFYIAEANKLIIDQKMKFYD